MPTELLRTLRQFVAEALDCRPQVPKVVFVGTFSRSPHRTALFTLDPHYFTRELGPAHQAPGALEALEAPETELFNVCPAPETAPRFKDGFWMSL